MYRFTVAFLVIIFLCFFNPVLAIQDSNPEAGNIAALMEDSRVDSAFSHLEDMREINNERLIAITEIPAPPFAEEARAADIAARMQALGLDDVEIDAAGNVIGIRAGLADETGNRIAIVAHLDTVFPAGTDVTVRREGDVFYAPGIGDNSRGLVALLSLIETLEANDLQTDRTLMFVASSGEEGLGDLRGVRHLMASQGDAIGSFIAIDGGEAHRLVTTAVGSMRYRVTFRGTGGHSYAAFGRAHPHQALAEAITRFVTAATPLTTDGVKATFSVGRIEGGTSVNSIPFESAMEVDMRSADQDKLNALQTAFLASVNEALEVENGRMRDGEPLTVDIETIGDRPAGRNDPNSPLVRHAIAALAARGIEAELVESSTDSNIAISMGIPAVTISRGGISNDAHSPQESWEDVDAHIALQSALLLLLAEAGLTAPASGD
tara:strand:+ start:6214 stop:7521 length:1308 start_codon:yes stop_codon:yes gene_type:complete